MTWHFLL